VAVPPRYLTVWSGGPFPYFGALSIASMLEVDAEATVELHHLVPVDQEPSLSRMVATGRLELHAVTPSDLFTERLLDLFRRLPANAHAARSNLIRIALLHRRGGVYLDLDTFLLKPLHRLAPGAFVGLERVWRHDRLRVEGRLPARHWPETAAWGALWAAKRADTALFAGHLRVPDRLRRLDEGLHALQLNNAVIGTPAASELTEALLEQAPLRDPSGRYSLGPALLHDTIAADHRLATVMNPEVLYPVQPSESHRYFADRTLALGSRAAVVHYVQSNHKELLASVHPGDPRFGRSEVFWSLARQSDNWLRHCGQPVGMVR
jgi:hypothetical protein